MKVLKLKVGEIYKDGENYPVFETFWRRESKDKKKIYYESKRVIFINDIPDKPKITEESVIDEL
jgi:hypothetical protein